MRSVKNSSITKQGGHLIYDPQQDHVNHKRGTFINKRASGASSPKRYKLRRENKGHMNGDMMEYYSNKEEGVKLSTQKHDSHLKTSPDKE